jgi:dTDP-4-amino-4,6-dideoxygalactose transaminase
MLHLFRQSSKNQKNSRLQSCDIFSYLPQSDDFCFASTGRSLINLLIKSLGLTRKDSCLIPSYVAEGVISPFIHNGIRIQFYNVNEKLLVDPEAIAKQVENDPSIRILVLIHPFGFEQPIKRIKQKISGKANTYILEDCAQALFSKESGGRRLGEQGDFTLYSLNKFLPVPDGAILQNRLPSVTIANVEFKAENEQRRVSILDYIQHLHLNFEMFQSNEPCNVRKILERTSKAYDRYYAFINQSFDLFAPSSETINQLKIIDFDSLIVKRTLNSKYLYDNLKTSSFRFVYEKWNGNCIPMAVPVYVVPEQRNEIISKLFERNLLLSTLIDKWEFIPEKDIGKFVLEKKFIDSHLLIPVNEFLSVDNMEKMIEILNEI